LRAKPAELVELPCHSVRTIFVSRRLLTRTRNIAYGHAGFGEADEFFVFANRAFGEKTLNYRQTSSEVDY